MVYYPVYDKGVFEQELPPRKYKRALRPAYLVNSFGGTISWDAWLGRTKMDPDLEIEAMVFEDGVAVDAKGVIGFVGYGQTRATIFRGRDQ